MLEKDMPKYFTNKYLPPRDPGTKRALNPEEYKYHIDQLDKVPGACAVPVGCAFGFKKSVWEKVGGFDENLKSMHEDYQFSTDLLIHRYQNYQLRYPILYHVLSATFSTNPELRAYQLMRESAEYYKKKYGGTVTEVADVLFNKQKTAVKVKYLDSTANTKEEFCTT
jgi:GT2 family glycosyltransferase